METKQYAIGIDVGGTNTDAVIMEYPGRKIISYAKTGTTEDFNTGIMNSIQKVLVSQSAITENHISSLMIGTTTFLNAIIQRSSELNKVEVIRLCGPTSIAYPPFMTFPKQLAKSIQSSTHFIGGGYEYDKQLITPLDTKKLAEIAQELFSKYKNSKEILSIAVMGIFSPLYHEQEIEAKKILQTVFKENNFSNYRISLSHKIAGLGLLEREGATLLNASLIALARKTIYVLQESLAKLRLVNCKNNIFLTQNDGTLISCEKASKYPIFTSNSGPNNSLRGAAALTNTRNGFVVDIGGTSTDVAVLKNGFARPASSYVKIGGIRTNFFLADTISIALGGGSLVRFSEDGKKCVIGPSSVGYKLPHSAQVFGGTILTTTDIAVASGILTLDGADPSLVKATKEQLALARAEMISMLSNAVDKMKSTSEEVPIILVGGGSALFPTNMKIQGISEIIRPEHFSVANAVGAGIAQVSSTAELCMDLGVSGAMDAQEKLKEKAIELAVNKGAIRDTIVLFVEKLHIAYISANHFRVTYRAVGDIDTRNFSLGMTGLDEPSSIADVVIESSVIKPFTEEIKDLEDHKEFTFAEPIVVEENGEKVWILSEEDVECIGLGAAILGAGGGGSPYASVLELTSLVREGMKIKVISIDSLKEDEYVIYVAYYGAPLMMLERLGGSKKIAIALETMRSFFPDKKVVAVSAIEIGGLNSLAPLYVSGVTGLPTVDIDFMGRAFPQFQMTTLSIYDKSLGPCCMSDEKGNQILVCSVQDNLPVNFETQLRKIAMNLGLECGLAGPPISSNDVKAVGVRDTVSRVWRLGRTLLQARAAKLHPLRILEEVENAKLIFEGKIVDVMRATVDGYNKGTMIIQGLGEYEQRNLMIEFQNENLIAREYDSSTKCDDKGIPLESKVLAVVPDLITLCDSEDFQPVLTEDLRYGLRISVITLPANPILISERALGVVGPKCFGYNDVEFLPSAEYVSPKSVFKQ